MRRKSSNGRKVRFSPTQKDIADALGVSQSTVAMALSPQHEHKLLVETVEKIRKYAAEVGYHPQRFAQIMQGGHTRIVGVIVRLGIYTNNHEMVSMLANELSRAGYRLVLVDPAWFGGNYEAVKKYLLDQGVEGVVFCNVSPNTEATALRNQLPATMPVFSLQSSRTGGPSLRADLEAAYYHMTRLHLALGSQRISLLSMFRDPGHLAIPAWTVRDRVNGFIRSIQEVGGVLVADEDVRELMEIPNCRSKARKSDKIVGHVIYPIRRDPVRNAYENGFNQTRQLIDSDALPDSLICANDDGALGAMAACSDRGLSLPHDVRISGHDDTMAGRFGAVPLTTIRPPLEALTTKTAAGIVSCIKNPAECSSDTPLPSEPCDIVVTSSCGTREELQQVADTGFFQSRENIRFVWTPGEDRLHRFEGLIPNNTTP